MYPPVDYPLNDDSSNNDSVDDDMTYAALLGRHESEEVITEAMIQSACLRIETAQQFPFACKPELQAFTELTQESSLDDPVTTEQQSSQIKEQSPAASGTVKLSTAKALSRWIRVIS